MQPMICCVSDESALNDARPCGTHLQKAHPTAFFECLAGMFWLNQGCSAIAVIWVQPGCVRLVRLRGMRGGFPKARHRQQLLAALVRRARYLGEIASS